METCSMQLMRGRCKEIPVPIMDGSVSGAIGEDELHGSSLAHLCA